jgi:hypothetical protein
MHRVTIIILLAMTAMLGACQDVPIDDGSSTVVIKPKDSSPARTLRLDSGSAYIYYAEKPKVDTLKQKVEIDLSSRDVMTRFSLDSTGGKRALAFEFSARIPWPDGAPHSLRGVQRLWVNVERVDLDRPNAPVYLKDDPGDYDNEWHKTGAGVVYPVQGSPNNYPYTTGHGGSTGLLTITAVDARKRTIEGKLDLMIAFTGSGPLCPTSNERLRKFEIRGATIRLAY